MPPSSYAYAGMYIGFNNSQLLSSSFSEIPSMLITCD